MANKNFIVHNGLIVGSANIDAATGNANVGNLTTIGQLVSTKTGDTADGNAQIYLNGATLNRIDFNTSGTAAPAFTTRSAGSKIVLYPSTTGSATDYAIGINSATLWQSLPQNDASMYFRWYGGTTEVANLSGTGMLTISGNANVGNLIATAVYTDNYKFANGAAFSVDTSQILNGNSNVKVAANSNVTVSVAGNANVVTVTGTGANVSGTANITGNVLAGANVVYTGNLYQGAQLRYAHAYTASTAAPSGSTVGDYWYDTATDILYLRVSDGTTPLWFDVSSQANTFSDTTTTNATITTASITTANISGNINAANLQNGTSNLRIVASGNISASVGGTANVAVWTTTGANITGTLGVTGNITSGNLATSVITATGTIFTQGATGAFVTRRRDTNADAYYIYSGAGELRFYDAVGAADRVILSASGNLYPNGNGTQQLGLTTNRWSNIWGLASSAQYADLAERYASDDDYSPGTVVIFGGNAEITVTNADHDPRIAGVISTNPGYLMNDSADQDALMLPVALTGRVPTRVRGPISKGDMVVSSTEEGVAIRMQKELYEPGCVIGKSLENILDDSIQTIEVVVGRL